MKNIRILAMAVVLVLVVSLAAAFWLRPKSISREQAMEIATAYMKEHEPSVDISYGIRSVIFSADADPSWLESKEKGVWSVTFGIPAPPNHSRRIISRHVSMDKYGHVFPVPITTSP